MPEQRGGCGEGKRAKNGGRHLPYVVTGLKQRSGEVHSMM